MSVNDGMRCDRNAGHQGPHRGYNPTIDEPMFWLEEMARPYSRPPALVGLEYLDIIADLLTESARRKQAARKELNKAYRDAQREARDAYAEGRSEGRREGQDW